jgi:hypothetical protein
MNIEIGSVEIEGSIAYDLTDYYDWDEKEGDGYVPTKIYKNIFQGGVSELKDYPIEDIVIKLEIHPNDNIDMEKFDYEMAYNILIELFERNLERAIDDYGVLSIDLLPKSDKYFIYIDEDSIFTYFLRNVLNERGIDIYDLVEAGLLPYKIEPVSTEEFKRLYKYQSDIKVEKEMEEAGQMKLFDNIDYIKEIDEITEEVYANIKNIDELVIKYGGESMKPTPEMEKFFKERTKKHIDLVKKYCEKIQEVYGDQFEGIVERGKTHDQSKWADPEVVPYIYITWDYKHKDAGESFDLPEDIRILMNDASEHHVNNNLHHPEYHCPRKGKINRENRDEIPDEIIDATAMNGLDIAEMCADFCAMSEEKGNSPIDWADKNIGTRWKFNDEAVYYIYDILNNIWSD